MSTNPEQPSVPEMSDIAREFMASYEQAHIIDPHGYSYVGILEDLAGRVEREEIDEATGLEIAEHVSNMFAGPQE